MAQRLPAKDEPPHVDVAQQRRDRSPLRGPFPFLSRPVRAALAALTVLLDHRHLQPRLDEAEHPSVAHAPRDALHQLRVRYLAEVVREVRINHFVAAPVQQTMDPSDRVLGASSRPVSVLLRLQVRLEDRRQHQHRRRLRNPVPQAWNAQGTELPRLLLRDEHLSHRTRLVGAFLQVPRQFPDPAFHSVRLDVRDRDTIHACRSAVAPGQRPCRQQEVLPPYLVDKGVKSPPGFFLRFRM